MPNMARMGAWFAVVVLLPAAVFAQESQRASVTGVVKDSSGAVLPGVTVEVSSPVLIEKTRSDGHRRQRPVPHHRPAAGHVHGDVYVDRIPDRQA